MRYTLDSVLFRHRLATALSLATALPGLLGACGDSSVADPGAAASAPVRPASSPEAPAPRCVDGALRCSSPTEVERCEAGQRWTSQMCDEGSGCVQGVCVALELEGESYEPASLWRLPSEGWLNAWSSTRGLPDRQIPADDSDPRSTLAGESAHPVHALCSPRGYVQPFDGLRRDAGAPHIIGAGVLAAGKAQEALLASGVSGRLRLWLNGKRVLDRKTTPGHGRGDAFRDEHLTPIELRAGLNSITWVATIDQGRAPSFWLRVRAAHGARLPGLRYREGGSDARCSVAQVLEPRTEMKVTADGFDLSLRPRLRGVAPPRSAVPITIGAQRAGEPDQALWKGDWDADALASGSVERAVSFHPARDGEHLISLRAGPDPDAAPRELKKLVARKALQRRMADLKAARDGLARSVGSGTRQSFSHHVDRIERAIVEGERYPDWLEDQVEDAEQIAAALAEGRDPYSSRTGVVSRAYRSRLDGQLQPYVVFVPPSYRPDGPPMPMALIAHGLDRQPEHALRTLIGQAPTPDMGLEWAAKHLPAFPDLGVILVAPYGYQNAGPRGIGEQDLLRVIEEMQRDYRIDPQHISLTGYSLGGTVAFVAPLHHPDVFSASAPLCGYPNLKSYRSIRGVPHQPWEEVMIGRRAIANYAENGRHLPLHIVHGGLDGPARSKVVVDRYRALGYSHRFDVQDELGHNVWDYAYENGRMVAWLRGRKRPEAPKRVRLRTGEHRYRRSFWVELFGMQDSRAGVFADVDANYDADAREVKVTTQGTSAFAIHVGQLRPKPEGTLRVRVDGTTFEVPASEATSHFTKSADGWQRAATPPALNGKKHADVAGPLDDALRHPLVVVYGTQRDVDRDANRIVAEHFSSYDTFAGAHYPVRADRELTEDDIAATSLVLIGGPKSNRITAALRDGLPVAFDDSSISLRGSRFEGPDVGVSLITVHPRNPAEYVVLHAGVGATGTLSSRHLPRLAPDFLVYDGRITRQRGGMLLDRREVLAGGFFDEHWK